MHLQLTFNRTSLKSSTLNSYERGLSLPKEPLIIRLAILLDVSANYLKWGEQQLNCSGCNAKDIGGLCMDCATLTHAQLVDAYALLQASKFTFNPAAKETMKRTPHPINQNEV